MIPKFCLCPYPKKVAQIPRVTTPTSRIPVLWLLVKVFCTLRRLYLPPSRKLWEGNVVSRICLSVILSVHREGGQYRAWPHGPGPGPDPSPYRDTPRHVLTYSTWTALFRAAVPLDTFKLIQPGLHCTGSCPQTCSDLCNMDMFKLVHYVAHASVPKRAVGIRLKWLLVILEDLCFPLLNFFVVFNKTKVRWNHVKDFCKLIKHVHLFWGIFSH